VTQAVDLLEEIRAALDEVDPLLEERVVDIEMARLRVVTDPTLFRRVFGRLIGAAVAQTEPATSITVRVARRGKIARIEVVNERSPARPGALADVTAEAEEFRAVGGEIGATEAVDTATYWMTVPLDPETASAAHA
jgi:light-regulated signal transduction histidine kinase (bacteriophytochrome)